MPPNWLKACQTNPRIKCTSSPCPRCFVSVPLAFSPQQHEKNSPLYRIQSSKQGGFIIYKQSNCVLLFTLLYPLLQGCQITSCFLNGMPNFRQCKEQRWCSLLDQLAPLIDFARPTIKAVPPITPSTRYLPVSWLMKMCRNVQESGQKSKVFKPCFSARSACTPREGIMNLRSSAYYTKIIGHTLLPFKMLNPWVIRPDYISKTSRKREVH